MAESVPGSTSKLGSRDCVFNICLNDLGNETDSQKKQGKKGATRTLFLHETLINRILVT